jgi:hypothetical protein
MATVVDSSKQPLPAPEIIMRAAQEFNNTEYSLQNVLIGITKELTMPNTDQVQIGNTVFIGHTGEGKHKNVMDGRALNVDTAQNFVRNGLKYLAYLQDKDIRYYRTDFNAREYLSAFQFWYNKTKDTDTEVDVVQLDTGGYRAYIYIGDDSLQSFRRA